MPYQTLEIDISDHIARVDLNRPDVLNAMNLQMFADLKNCFEAINNNTSVRAVILAAKGRMFTAGLDLKEAVNSSLFSSAGEDLGRERERFHRDVSWMQRCLSAVDDCRVPVIAAVQDGCLGGGVDLVSACDIRLTTENAYFTIQEINIGIVADIGTLQRIPQLLPLGIVKELAYTGRKLKAKEALNFGFANRVLPDQESLMAAAVEMAQAIASKSPLAMRGTKHIINYQRDHSIHDGLAYVAAWNAGMLQGQDTQKALSSVLKKQQIEYDNLLEDNLQKNNEPL